MSNKLGVAITKCFYCRRDKDEILINTHLTERATKEIEKCHGKVINTEPCDKCKEYMEKGIICIGVKDGETDRKHPHRTGDFIVFKEEILDLINEQPELVEHIKKTRVMYLTESALKQILPERN